MEKKTISPLHCRDTALALAFLALLIWCATGRGWWVYAAMGLLFWGMVWPAGLSLPARCWQGLSHLLGRAVSCLLLTAVYILLVLPVGLLRRLLGRDALRLRLWRRGEGSVFVTREHRFVGDDLKNPY